MPLEHARVRETHGGAQSLEILDVHRPAEALAEENLVRPEIFGQASIAVDVGEVKLSAVLQDAVRLGEHRALIGERFTTQLEMTRSTDRSSTPASRRFSISPLRKRTFGSA